MDLSYVLQKVTSIDKAQVVLRDSLNQKPILAQNDIPIKCIACKFIEDNDCGYEIDKEDIISFISENIGKYIYMYTYSDEDGEFYSRMEHGGTFNYLPHLQISHH